MRRFRSREDDPFRRWKMTEEDWRNRRRWDDYAAAAEEMFARTDHELAPWNPIAGEQKKWARVAVLETLSDRIEDGLARWKD